VFRHRAAHHAEANETNLLSHRSILWGRQDSGAQDSGLKTND
jgi:hypothetical protein